MAHAERGRRSVDGGEDGPRYVAGTGVSHLYEASICDDSARSVEGNKELYAIVVPALGDITDGLLTAPSWRSDLSAT